MNAVTLHVLTVLACTCSKRRLANSYCLECGVLCVGGSVYLARTTQGLQLDGVPSVGVCESDAWVNAWFVNMSGMI